MDEKTETRFRTMLGLPEGEPLPPRLLTIYADTKYYSDTQRAGDLKDFLLPLICAAACPREAEPDVSPETEEPAETDEPAEAKPKPKKSR